jgi:hypothetical protein
MSSLEETIKECLERERIEIEIKPEGGGKKIG